MNERKPISKWGFGMAPISRRMQHRFDTAVQTALDLFYGNLELDEVSPEHLSELKGMFNRCLRQDQWDWFSVYTELGEPSHNDMRQIVGNLKIMRRAVLDKDNVAVELLKQRLIHNNLLKYLQTYQADSHGRDGSNEAGWIYILSTREQPNILKIGMTRRSIAQRVKEINSATGVLIPFAARFVFRVFNAAYAERAIFKLLQAYRIRPDREFFDLSFSQAVATIEQYLKDTRMRYRKRGEIISFNFEKRYGFISTENSENIFLHASQVAKGDLERLTPGTELEYDLGVSLQGACALDVQIVKDDC